MFFTGSPEGENHKGCVFVWREAPLHNWLNMIFILKLNKNQTLENTTKHIPLTMFSTCSPEGENHKGVC
jgi:hypothetical protein